MPLRIDLNEPKIREKVTSDAFGTKVSTFWRNYLNPYTPRDTGELMEQVTVEPFALHYRMNYASDVYFNEKADFQKINPFATHHWDVAAANAGQLSKLYRTLNTAITKGRI